MLLSLHILFLMLAFSEPSPFPRPPALEALGGDGAGGGALAEGQVWTREAPSFAQLSLLPPAGANLAARPSSRALQRLLPSWCASSTGATDLTAVGAYVTVDTGNPYLNNSNCGQMITTPSNFGSTLCFNRFVTEPALDFITVYATAALSGALWAGIPASGT